MINQLRFGVPDLCLPAWVPESEKAAIRDRIPGFTESAKRVASAFEEFLPALRLPLRPVWVERGIPATEAIFMPRTDCTPVYLLSASAVGLFALVPVTIPGIRGSDIGSRLNSVAVHSRSG